MVLESLPICMSTDISWVYYYLFWVPSVMQQESMFHINRTCSPARSTVGISSHTTQHRVPVSCLHFWVPVCKQKSGVRKGEQDRDQGSRQEL